MPDASPIARWKARSLSTSASTSSPRPAGSSSSRRSSRDRLLVRALRREPRGDRLELAPHLQHVEHGAVLVELGDEGDRVEQHVGLERGHVGPVALARVEDPHERQRPHRLAQRVARQAEALGEVGLAGQARTGLQLAGDDHLLDLLDRLVGHSHRPDLRSLRESADRTAVVRLSGVTKRFPGVLAVDSVDLEILPGEVHVVAGENGAGKSTLMKLLSQVERPDEGTVEIAGEPVAFHGPGHAQRLGVAMVYQEFALAPAPDRRREPVPRARAGALRRAQPRRGAPPRARAARGGAARRRPDAPRGLALGGRAAARGDRQGARHRRQARDHGRAHGRAPERDIDDLFEVIRELTSRGIAVLYISHRLDEIFRIGDRVTVMRDGAVVKTLPVAELDHDQLVRADGRAGDRQPLPEARGGAGRRAARGPRRHARGGPRGLLARGPRRRDPRARGARRRGAHGARARGLRRRPDGLRHGRARRRERRIDSPSAAIAPGSAT